MPGVAQIPRFPDSELLALLSSAIVELSFDSRKFLGAWRECRILGDARWSMDISELPHYVVFLLVLVTFFVVFVIAKRLSRRWLRWDVRAGASAGMVLTVLVLTLDYSCTARAPRSYSPDGRHVVVVSWKRTPLDDNLVAATIKVRHRYSPFAKTVYSGSGLWADEPRVRWIDNNHLLVRYYDWGTGDGEQVCAPHALVVEMICEKHFLGDGPF